MQVSFIEPLKSTCKQGVTNASWNQNKGQCSLPPINDLVTSLPVSGYDHAVNGLAFTHERTMLVCVGSSTNAGVRGPSLRYLPVRCADTLRVHAASPLFRPPARAGTAPAFVWPEPHRSER